MSGHSLQARLLALLLTLVAAVWLGAALLVWEDARHELDELLDAHLAQAAALLVVRHGGEIEQAHETEAGTAADAPALHKYAPRAAFQVFHDGRLVLRSVQAPAAPLANIQRGFATVLGADGHRWRVFAAQARESDVQVYVAEQVASRDDILWAILRSTLWPLAWALPLLALAGWWAVRQGLHPLRQLGAALRQRRPEALEPLTLPHAPTEMAPMVQALNDLFARIERMVEAERRFTADAAHELRTPVAAIRAQAQVALQAGPDEALRRHALMATLAGCDRAAHLVDQLLTLARLEGAAMALQPVDWGPLARMVLAELAPVALKRGQHLELQAPDVPVCVSGVSTWLAVLLRNLVDNALRYSPEGARVRVRIARQGSQVQLQVEDSGPGLPAQTLAQLGQRFYRPPGQTQSGSGLGWSIVRRIAQVSGGQIELGTSADLGGLAVTVRWPAADVAAAT